MENLANFAFSSLVGGVCLIFESLRYVTCGPDTERGGDGRLKPTDQNLYFRDHFGP